MGATSPVGDNDPAAYLAAALDTAEKTANAAANAWDYLWYTDLGNVLSPAEATHVADNNPEHVLRVILAHRALLHWHTGEHQCVPVPGHPDGWSESPCRTLRVLAGAYGWTVA